MGSVTTNHEVNSTPKVHPQPTQQDSSPSKKLIAYKSFMYVEVNPNEEKYNLTALFNGELNQALLNIYSQEEKTIS